jgi:hypothetical protein
MTRPSRQRRAEIAKVVMVKPGRATVCPLCGADHYPLRRTDIICGACYGRLRRNGQSFRARALLVFATKTGAPCVTSIPKGLHMNAMQAEILPELDDDQTEVAPGAVSGTTEDAQLRTALIYAAVNDELEAAIAEWEFAHDSQPIPANVLAEAQDTALAINQLVDALFATTG